MSACRKSNIFLHKCREMHFTGSYYHMKYGFSEKCEIRFFHIFPLNFRRSLYNFNFVWRLFTPVELYNRIEEMALFISHRDTIYPIRFILDDCVVICQTFKSALDISHFRRLLHSLKNAFPQVKKKYVSLIFRCSLTYFRNRKLRPGIPSL